MGALFCCSINRWFWSVSWPFQQEVVELLFRKENLVKLVVLVEHWSGQDCWEALVVVDRLPFVNSKNYSAVSMAGNGKKRVQLAMNSSARASSTKSEQARGKRNDTLSSLTGCCYCVSLADTAEGPQQLLLVANIASKKSFSSAK